MAQIAFEKDRKDLIVQKLKRYLGDELDFEIGQFDCEFLLDFISKEIGSFYYNQGLNDAQTLITSKLDDIGDALYEMEQPTGR